MSERLNICQVSFSKLNYAILGSILGDVLGVPFEFEDRIDLNNSVIDLTSGGTHKQPIGTWSDDSSMLLSTLDALNFGYNFERIANNFVKWFKCEDFTPHGKIFDIGMTTKKSLTRLVEGCNPLYSGEFDEYSNGNGSLMRIIPLLKFVDFENNFEFSYKITKDVSGITHSHIRSILSCVYYLQFLKNCELDLNKFEVYLKTNKDFKIILKKLEIVDYEISNFNRILSDKLFNEKFQNIHGTGYVIQSLEASLYCFLTTKNYKESVLKAVNLGDDTDTTACITGGISAYFYKDGIPEEWINKLVKKDYIFERLTF